MFDFIYGQFFSPRFVVPEVDLSGKVAVVTGANVGLGYEGAKHLATFGVSRLIFAVRNIEKGEAAAKKLKQEAPSWKGEVQVWQLDMASFDSVKAFAERLNTLDRLDILIESAGVASWDWRTTRDGWEETLQVNVISTGLFALLALPKLSATADIPGNDFKPHLVIVASEVHAWAKFPQQDAPSILAALNDKEKAIPKDIYNMSKLLDVLMTREIAQLPSAQKVNVNSLNPGLCKSELLRDIPWLFATMLRLVSWSTSYGALNYLYAATQDTVPGAYISFCKETGPSEFVRSPKGMKIQKKVFRELKDFWVSQEPKVKEIMAV